MSMHDSTRISIENRLLGMLQSSFPLSREPYEDIGTRLGISGKDVIRKIAGLKKRGIVRQISPVLDARKLGFQSTLIALKVKGPRIKKAEEYLISHPGISHGYQREHEYNIRVTLSVPPRTDVHSEVVNVCAGSQAEAVITLPAIKVFKLRTNFSHMDDTIEEDDVLRGNGLPGRVRLSQTDRHVINSLQRDLPLSADPFASMAHSLGMDVDQLLLRSRSLLRRGIIRRYGASINHRNAGYRANAMTCWNVPAGKVDKAGRVLASNRRVSHCYERATSNAWNYNLFAMVHSTDEETCHEIIKKMAADTELKDYIILFSIREFKKTRINYRV